MADPVSLFKALAFLITTIAMVVQMHFPNSSPGDKHSANVWIFIVCLFVYAFSSAYYKSHASTSNNDSPYFNLSSHIAVISGSMACAVLISVLVSKPVIALIIIIYFICLLVYFSPNPVTEKCKKIASYVHGKCKGIEHNDDPADSMELGRKQEKTKVGQSSDRFRVF